MRSCYTDVKHDSMHTSDQTVSVIEAEGPSVTNTDLVVHDAYKVVQMVLEVDRISVLVLAPNLTVSSVLVLF